MGTENFRIAAIQRTTRTGQARENLRIAEAYLAAAHARDLQAVGKTLHPELHFVGPMGEAHDRDGFLGIYDKAFAHLEKLDITSEALSDNLIYFKYYMALPAPQGPIHGTMKTTHADNGLIKKIEMTHQPAMLRNEPPQK